MDKHVIDRRDVYHVYPEAAYTRNVLQGAVIDFSLRIILQAMWMAGLFRVHHLTFRGGTAIRLFYSGPAGRFSFDLDITIARDDEARLAAKADIRRVLADLPISNITAALLPEPSNVIMLTSDLLPDGSYPAKLDLFIGEVFLPSTAMSPLPTPINSFAWFNPGLTIPVVHYVENIVDKLERLQRRRTTRDLYDLAQLMPNTRADVERIGELFALRRYCNYANPETRKAWPDNTLSDALPRRADRNYSLERFVLPQAVRPRDAYGIVAECMNRLREPFALIDERIRQPDLQPFLQRDDLRHVLAAQDRINEIAAHIPPAHHGIIYKPQGMATPSDRGMSL